MDSLLSPKEQLVANISDKVQSISARMAENKTSIEQHQLEVDRLNKQNINLGAQLKRVEDNFDSIPRDDIRDVYEKVIESQKRLISMRTQLQKLLEVQDYLDELHNSLEEILESLGGVVVEGAVTSDGDSGPVMTLAGEQIIRIVEAQESERKRLANALHDGPAQSLTNFILQAEICQRLFDRNPDMASNELINLKTAASFSFQKIRDFIFELRPMMLDDLGLIATMRRHTDNYNDKLGEGRKVEFHLTGAERRLPNHIEVMMFRGLQLLINNSLETLNAKAVTVKLDIGDRRLLGTVLDNGRKFDPEVELDRSQGDSPLQGLLDLQERLELVGGRLDIFSDEGGDNSFEITLPFTE